MINDGGRGAISKDDRKKAATAKWPSMDTSQPKVIDCEADLNFP
jgi:hypothetical protein